MTIRPRYVISSSKSWLQLGLCSYNDHVCYSTTITSSISRGKVRLWEGRMALVLWIYKHGYVNIGLFCPVLFCGRCNSESNFQVGTLHLSENGWFGQSRPERLTIKSPQNNGHVKPYDSVRCPSCVFFACCRASKGTLIELIGQFCHESRVVGCLLTKVSNIPSERWNTAVS